MQVGNAQQPSVAAGGILNAASYALLGLPNAGIAQGAIFVLFGANLGPTSLVRAGSFPLPTELAGTRIRVTVSGSTTDAVMLYTSANQVAAIMPSNTPVGDGTLILTYNGVASTGAAVRVVKSSFGIFSRNEAGSGPAWVQHASATDANLLFNSLANAGRPGQTFTIYGTGLAAVTFGDTQRPQVVDLPVNVEVLVGGKKATILYKGRSAEFPGLDQINFTLPADTSEGCYVPLAVKVEGIVSNFTTMSVGRNGGTCSDAGGLSAQELAKIQSGSDLSIGVVALTRTGTNIVAPSVGTISVNNDVGTASFFRYRGLSLLASGGASGANNPPLGSCSVFTFKAGGSNAPTDPILPTVLDAGSSITVTGPAGTKSLTKQGTANVYSAVLGGGATGIGGITPPGAQPDFLNPGSYTITNGSGGVDVGSFSITLNLAAALSWTNRDAITAIDRSQSLAVNWTGGDASQIAFISGFSTAGQVGAGFTCIESAARGTFTVPAEILSALPASAEAGGAPTGFVSVGSATLLSNSNKFTARGLDLGYVTTTTLNSKNLAYK